MELENGRTYLLLKHTKLNYSNFVYPIIEIKLSDVSLVKQATPISTLSQKTGLHISNVGF